MGKKIKQIQECFPKRCSSDSVLTQSHLKMKSISNENNKHIDLQKPLL